MARFDYAQTAIDSTLGARRRMDPQLIRHHIGQAACALLQDAIEQRVTHMTYFSPRADSTSVSVTGHIPNALREVTHYSCSASLNVMRATPWGGAQRLRYWMDPDAFIASTAERLARMIATAEAAQLANQPKAPRPAGWAARVERLALDAAAGRVQAGSKGPSRI